MIKKKTFAFVCFVLITFIIAIPNFKSNSIVVKAFEDKLITTSTPLSEVSEEKSNLISYDYETGEMKYLYFNNSIAAAENELLNSSLNSPIFSLQNVIGDDDRIQVNDTTLKPYRFVARLKATNYEYYDDNFVRSTAAFIGPNVLLTAAHCIFKNENGTGSFYKRATVFPAKNGKISPYGSFEVKKAYMAKEYASVVPDAYQEHRYDWAVLVIERNEELIASLKGNFGKIANYSPTDLAVETAGYPGEKPSDTMWKAPGIILETTLDKELFGVTCDSTAGQSGSPVFTYLNGNAYIIGILTGSNDKLTCVRLLDSFIYLLTNSLLADNCIEVKDYYIEGIDDVQYNCLVKVIINPAENARIEVSSDGNNYNTSYSKLTELFYASSTNSTKGNIPYDYYRTYYNDTKTYSTVRRITTTHSTDEISTKYTIVNRTASGNVIATNFDKSSNVWKHNGKNGKMIKGTIAHNGEAKNIEVKIPFIGYNISAEVEVGGVTFQLRTGPNKVSIKANKEIKCDDTQIVFAFGIE